MYAKIKTIFHRYMLANIAIKEFSTKETWAESRVHMLKVLEEQIKWPDALDNKSDMNHMVEMFNSFSLAAEKMKNTFGKQNAE